MKDLIQKKNWAPWSEEVSNVLTNLKSTESGLLEIEAQKRIKKFGKNVFEDHEKKSPFLIFLEQLSSPLIFILIGAAVITIVLQEWIEVVVIFLAVFVNAGLGFYREYRAENTLEKLMTYIKDRSKVIRDGREQEIDSADLTKGDVIKLSYGSRIPADARIIKTNNFKVDESILTGESIPVSKNEETVLLFSVVADRKNMAYAGTLVVEGFATAVVTSIGNDTEVGKIAKLVSKTNRVDSPIQKALKNLAWLIFGVLIFVVIGIFILGIFRGEPVFEMLILSAAVSVGAVPEALPIALTMILSIGAERIANKKGITRTLAATETLGSATLIMTDKTGTLTEANMKLRGVYTPLEMKKNILHFSENISLDEEHKNILSLALMNIDVSLENPKSSPKDWNFIGRPIEVNIAKVSVLNNLVIDFKKNSSSIIMPFNSTNKFSVSEDVEKFIVMGAPDILLKKSKLSKNDYLDLENWITKASNAGNRLLGIGVIKKTIRNKNLKLELVNNINFCGIIAFHDPIRSEVPEAIKNIEAFGVKIVMVTGDLTGTAVSVANSLGWNVKDDQILSGEDIRNMSDERLLEVIENIKIFSRVTPEDKLRIGNLYRDLGEVVAMTGDGVNDAPALKSMDIGVALGSGSDVAKSAADLVLLDDNFKTISLAIQEGRRVLSNIRKTFIYLMSNSLDEVFVIGGSLIFGLVLPLNALQIIWVNLFTGSLPALAFSFDEDFDQKIVSKKALKSILNKEASFLTFGIGILTSILLFLLHFWLVKSGIEIEIARSIFFTCFASYILVVAFCFRSLEKSVFSYPVFSNQKLNLSVIFATIMLILTLNVPFMRDIFQIGPLPFKWLWIVGFWLILNVFLVEITKYFFRIKNI